MTTRATKTPKTTPAPPDLRVGTLTVDRIVIPGRDGKPALEASLGSEGCIEVSLTVGLAHVSLFSTSGDTAGILFWWDGTEVAGAVLSDGKMSVHTGSAEVTP